MSALALKNKQLIYSSASPFEVDSEMIGVMLEAGFLYLEMHQYDNAEAVFKACGELAPHNETALSCLGNVFFAKNNFKQALYCYKQALLINPDSVSSMAHAAEILFFMKDSTEALQLLKKANNYPEGTIGKDFAKALLEGYELGVFSPTNIDKVNEELKNAKAK